MSHILREEEESYLDPTQVDEIIDEDPNEEIMDVDDEAEDAGDADDQYEIEEEDLAGELALAGNDIHIDEEGNLVLDMTNTSVGHFDKHGKSIFLIDSHPTLPLIISGGEDEKAYLWTTNSQPPKLVAELPGQKESVVAGGFSPDGGYVVTGDMEGQVRAWKSAKRGQQWDFVGSVQEVDEITWIVFHPKQPFFAFGSREGSVWVMSLDDFSNVAILIGHSQPTNAAVFANVDDMDSLTLITVGDDAIISWNVYQSTPNYSLREHDLQGNIAWISCALSGSGKTIACGSADGKVALINVERGTVLKVFDNTQNDSVELEERSVEALAWAPISPILAVGNVKGDITLYDVTSWNIRKTLALKDAITAIKFIPGSNKLLSSDMAGELVKWDVLSGRELWRGHGHFDGILGFTVQDNGKRVITAGDQGVSMIFEDSS
ncbi:uncharacterized protein SAPINGB_P005137 [Magnusiomyces paraingens]|uniref:Uncharacterized protein n=1 Tax=Magnusiomyces paraingens TaxID=2606893 RepID=A0A5E8BZJ4_9ASCO|nr:uncharacterized protein SAPINGB_P005137 [Saprochaete ingens]VVT56532.1 unnamed protein product [Saprochaete ingens]